VWDRRSSGPIRQVRRWSLWRQLQIRRQAIENSEVELSIISPKIDGRTANCLGSAPGDTRIRKNEASPLD
jgi:hypothetical protein